MIDRLALGNFKCFVRSEPLRFTQLNILAGANGTGKSTIVQALLLLFQSVDSGALKRGRLQLNGPLIDLGTGRDVLYRRSEADSIELEVWDGEARHRVVARVPASESRHTLEAVVTPGPGDIECVRGQLFYLSADRLGPQKLYAMNLDESLGNEVGRRGEFAPLLYSRARSKDVGNDLLLLENTEKQKFPDLETQFTLWMRRLFPGFQVHTDRLDQLDAVLLGLNLQEEIGKTEYMRPTNVGFGVSVAFPIVLCGLLANKGATFIVENPEAHLHPSAQSLVGEFLARVAAGGAQLFVETHSDHLVNGIRIAMKNKVVPLGHLSFFAFSKTDQYGSHKVSEVRLDENGDFASRPESFFDQTDKDLKAIYGF